MTHRRTWVRGVATWTAATVASLGLAGRSAAKDWEIAATGVAHRFAPAHKLGQATGATAASVETSVGAGLRASFWLALPEASRLGLGVEAEALWLPTALVSAADSAGAGNATVRDSATVLTGLGQVVVAAGSFRFQAVLAAGVGASLLVAHSAQRANSTAAYGHAGLGVRFLPAQDWSVRAEARWLATPAASGDSRFADDMQALLAVGYRFGAPLPVAVHPQTDDSDDDGVPDQGDVCPFVAETANGIRDSDGCPEHPEVLARGATPTDLAADASSAQEADDPWAKTLPPLAERRDADGDGIWGDDDQCPLAKEDVDGYADFDGCPDDDNDGDGVNDADDKCPLEAEAPNGYLDGDGCPDEVPAALRKFTGVIEGIYFDSKSVQIIKKSEKVLLAAAQVLLQFAHVRVQIAGHCDDVGTAAYNLTLSHNRAQAVCNWLIHHGISADRLTAIGHGNSQPRQPEATEQARQLNRRVEFILVGGGQP
ncbi:MAG: OmpA family protein [Myxococcales bacterium]|nr:OmpA family protein [Myxococcales bacterium]